MLFATRNISPKLSRSNGRLALRVEPGSKGTRQAKCGYMNVAISEPSLFRTPIGCSSLTAFQYHDHRIVAGYDPPKYCFRGYQQAGKPKGARHRSTLAAEALLDGEGEQLMRKAVDLALGGDTIALRLCLDRIIPPRRERLVRFKLPPPAIGTARFFHPLS